MKLFLVSLLLASASASPAPKAREGLDLREFHERITGGINARSIEARQLGTSTTENQLTDGTGCRAMTIIFARGTTEAGNVGSLAGPPLFQAVADQIGTDQLAVQGVDYPADVAGFLAGGDAGGSQLMSQLVGQAQTQCPQTKLVMSGYSQGGQLVHNAAKMLSASQTEFVNSVVIFGDPDNGQAVGGITSSKVDVICHQGDEICAGKALVLPPHLTYSQDAGSAADFVVGQAGL